VTDHERKLLDRCQYLFLRPSNKNTGKDKLMTNSVGTRGFLAAIAMIVGTAALADDDSDNQVQIMPLGNFAGMNMMVRPIDTNADGIVSASEASQHASAGFALFDGDGDSQISEDEYLDSAPFAMPRGRRNVERLFVNRIARFDAMDVDGDDNVTLAEFMAAAQASFEAADTNDDGNVTVWEFRAQRNPF
jgi:hypothetical protein